MRVFELTRRFRSSSCSDKNLFSFGAEVEREKEFRERTAIVEIICGGLLLEIVKILSQKKLI